MVQRAGVDEIGCAQGRSVAQFGKESSLAMQEVGLGSGLGRSWRRAVMISIYGESLG